VRNPGAVGSDYLFREIWERGAAEDEGRLFLSWTHEH
jgi:hypothetical protein